MNKRFCSFIFDFQMLWILISVRLKKIPTQSPTMAIIASQSAITIASFLVRRQEESPTGIILILPPATATAISNQQSNNHSDSTILAASTRAHSTAIPTVTTQRKQPPEDTVERLSSPASDSGFASDHQVSWRIQHQVECSLLHHL